MENNQLNFYFFNTLCSGKMHDFLFKEHNVISGNAAQNFFGLIADGLSKNENTKISVNSILPVNSKEQKKIYWKFANEKEDDIDYFYIPLINLPILKNLLSSLYIFFKIIFQKFSTNSKNVIVVDFLRFSINFSVYLACKLRGIKILVIVTDLPGEGVKEKTFKSYLRNLFVFSLTYDCYVCLTEDLNTMVNKKNRPHLTVEGFANKNYENHDNLIDEKYNEKVVIYAGGLFEQYGIRFLIDGFKMIEDPNIRLWLFGVGPFTDEIIDYTKTDKRIEYKGMIPTQELIPILKKATVLINPRPSHEDFTKYSFPSKNLEYMSVGTPLVTTNLPGIPEDHYPFIYLIEDESDQGIYETLNEVLNKSKEELHKFGLECKYFTLTEKNNVVQTGKIIKMIHKNL